MKNLYKIEDELYIISDKEKSSYCIKECPMAGLNIDKCDCPILGSCSNKVGNIILTTNDLLIKNGVQAIDDEFLEWFVKNPSCEEIKTSLEKEYDEYETSGGLSTFRGYEMKYKIIIPKEEFKTAWVGVLQDDSNRYYPAEYEIEDIYQGEGCLPNFPNKELCQIWCDFKYKEALKQEKHYMSCSKSKEKCYCKKQETAEEAAKRLYPIYKGGSMWMPSRDDLNKANKQEGFIKGAKWQIDKQDNFAVGFAEWSVARALGCDTFTINQDELNIYKKYIDTLTRDAYNASQERSYSEEDMKLAFEAGYDRNTLESLGIPDSEQDYRNFKEWFEQFKKK